ncbi:hypothetical protein K5D57_06445 [Pseudomonas cichorii]|nr:hypothetical protein [Pseudomonas cichorii]
MNQAAGTRQCHASLKFGTLCGVSFGNLLQSFAQRRFFLGGVFNGSLVFTSSLFFLTHLFTQLSQLFALLVFQ